MLRRGYAKKQIPIQISILFWKRNITKGTYKYSVLSWARAKEQRSNQIGRRPEHLALQNGVTQTTQAMRYHWKQCWKHWTPNASGMEWQPHEKGIWAENMAAECNAACGICSRTKSERYLSRNSAWALDSTHVKNEMTIKNEFLEVPLNKSAVSCLQSG